MSPVWQVRLHVPLEQTWPPWQTLPECVPEQSALAPQKELLLVGSMQTPSQLTRPVWQDRLHVPFEQTWPAWQTLPECVPEQSALAPQKELLLRGSMHVPLQSMSSVWQDRLHVPFEQIWPAWQTLPECVPEQSALAPQWELLLLGSMQAPLQLTSPC
jgi:hypothetical protein